MADTSQVPDTDLAFAGAAELARALRAGTVTAPDLTELFLERIERIDPNINAYRCVRTEAARAEAAAAQARIDAGEDAPLLGVPVAVKDNVDIEGERTLHGSTLNRKPAAADSEVVARLRTAGAVILGKTNMPELALWAHFTETRGNGITRNPWNLDRTPCGSSGGSAAAVAAGLAAVALASDGGASIRVPAAACGLFGIKPQRDRVPLSPDEDHWLGLSHFGPIARTVEDAALFMDAVADPPPGGAESWHALATDEDADVRPLRVAISTKPVLVVRVRKTAREAVARTADALRELGHTVIERDPDYGQMIPVMVPRYVRGVYRDARSLGAEVGELAPITRGNYRIGRRMGRVAARVRRAEPGRAARINAIFDDVDVLLTPTTAAPPPKVGRGANKHFLPTFLGASDWQCFTPQWNLTGQPAAAVPAGFDRDGMPMSVQLVAPPDGEARLFQLAAQLERARPWRDARPPTA